MKIPVLLFGLILSCNGGTYSGSDFPETDSSTTQMDSIFSVVDSAVQVVKQQQYEKEVVIDSLKREVENHKLSEVEVRVKPTERVKVVYDTVKIYIDTNKNPLN